MIQRTIPLIAALVAAAVLAVPSSSLWADSEARPNQFWWPEQLDLRVLRQHDARSNPFGEDFDYAAAFQSLDLAEVKADIEAVMTTSQDW